MLEKPGTTVPRRRASGDLEDLLGCLMQALRTPVRLDEMNLGVMNEQPLIEDPRMANDRHVLLDLHVLIASDQRTLDHVVAHAMHADALLLWQPALAQVQVVLCEDLPAQCAGLEQ